MRIATIHTDAGTAAVRVDDDAVVEIEGAADVGELLRDADWADRARNADGPRHDPAAVRYTTLVPRPGKVVCVGLNYIDHIREMGRELPEHPTLFAKFADTLTGPFDDIEAVADDPWLDWEGELAVVVGAECRRVTPAEAERCIAGYAVANDVSMREWQNRTGEWLQGKAWAASTPIGPWLRTADAFDPSASAITTTVGDRVVQRSDLSQLRFTPAALVSYVSRFTPLRPGDVLLTGTPGGVGHARRPAEYLSAGDVVSVEVDGLGRIENRIVEPATATATATAPAPAPAPAT